MHATAAPMVASKQATRLPNRVVDLEYRHDWLGNMNTWDDDAHAFYERSIGKITNGAELAPNSATPATRPSALYLASNLDPTTPADLGGWLETDFGAGGNVLAMTVHAQCTHALANDWPTYEARFVDRATTGKFALDSDRVSNLHPYVRELLTDLTYVGAPYSFNEKRHSINVDDGTGKSVKLTTGDRVNQILSDTSLDTVGQLEALKTFVESLPNEFQNVGGKDKRVAWIDARVNDLESSSNASAPSAPTAPAAPGATEDKATK